jgi:hypothetical protein
MIALYRENRQSYFTTFPRATSKFVHMEDIQSLYDIKNKIICPSVCLCTEMCFFFSLLFLNGGWLGQVDGSEICCGHSVPLHHHSRVQISDGIWFTFMLPIVALKSRTYISSSASLVARKTVYRQRSVNVLADFDDEMSSSDTEDETSHMDDGDAQTCSIALFKKEMILPKNIRPKKRPGKSEAGKKGKVPGKRRKTPVKGVDVSVIKNEKMSGRDATDAIDPTQSLKSTSIGSTSMESNTREAAPTTALSQAQTPSVSVVEGETKKLRRPRKTYAHSIREALLTRSNHEMSMEDVFSYFMHGHEFYRETDGKLWKPKVVANVSQHEAFEFVDENATIIRLKREFVSRDTTRHVNPTIPFIVVQVPPLSAPMVDEGKDAVDAVDGSKLERLQSMSLLHNPIEPAGPLLPEKFLSSSSSTMFVHHSPQDVFVPYSMPPSGNGEPPAKRFKLMEPQDVSFERVPIGPRSSSHEESGSLFNEMKWPRWDSHNPLEQSLTACRRVEPPPVDPDHVS